MEGKKKKKKWQFGDEEKKFFKKGAVERKGQERNNEKIKWQNENQNMEESR